MMKILQYEKNTLQPGTFNDLASNKTVWADVENPTAEELAQVAGQTAVKVEELGEFLKISQRPLLFNLEQYSVVIVSQPVAEKDAISTAPVVFFVSKRSHNLITVHHSFSQAIKKMYGYPAAHGSTIFRGGATVVLVTLLGEIIDGYFTELEAVSDQIEEIEQKMFDYKHSHQIMKKTFAVKKSLIYIHKALVANRDVVVAIEKQYAQFLDNKQLENFRGLGADITQLIEMTSTYRDIITSAIEIHLSSISNNLNVTMKKVTSWGAIILVPSLVAGIFGMNFKHIPALDSPGGFFLALFLMAASMGALTWYFKRRDWL